MSTNWLEYDKLAAAMRGQSTLEGFDVLVSYSETELNRILQAATTADKMTAIKVPEFITSVAGQWPSPALTTYKIDLVLNKPNFAFAGPSTSAEVILTFVLAGTVSIQNPDKTWSAPTILPPGLGLAITSQLSAVTGSVHPDSPGSRFIPATPPNNPSGDTGVNLATAGTTSAIVIYIPKEEGSGGTVSISADGTVDPNTKYFLQSLVKGNMETFFKTQDWFYYLTQVNNAAPENSGGKYELQPTSFGFSVSAGNGLTDPATKVDNAVCMWITVQGGSGRAVLAPGQSCTANFSVGNTSTMPIPINHGSSASIIFSHQLIETLFFEAALTDNNCTAVVSSDAANQAGMQIEFLFPSYAVHKDKVDYSHTDFYFGGSTTTIKKVDAIDFNLNHIKAVMTLNPNLSVEGSPVGSITWTTDTIKMHWVSDVDTYTAGHGGGGGFGDDHSGITDLVFSFKGQGSWVNNSQAGDDVLSFSWALPASFDISVTAEKKDLSWWDRLWSDWDNGVPQDLQNLTFKLPTLSSVNSINYFLTTNLLLPGEHVFKPDPLVAASASDQKGISIPYDVLLTGVVAPNFVTTIALSPHGGGLTTTTKPLISDASRASRRDLLNGFKLGQGARGAKSVNGTSGVHRANGLKSPQGLSAVFDKSLDDFVNTILTCDPKGIMGPLVTAAASADPDDAAATVLDLLQKNGYGNITPDQIYSVLGSSTAEVTAAMASNKALRAFQLGAKKRPIDFQALANFLGDTTFNLTVFGAVYNITDGPGYVKELIVSTSDGTLTCDGDILYPECTTDTSTVPHKTTVTWTTSKGSYTAVFKTSFNSAGVSYAYFEGTATPSGGTSQKFAGTQKEKAEDPIPDEPVQIADFVGVFFGFIGVIAFIAAVYWRKRDLAAVENGRLYQGMLKLDTYTQERANTKALEMMKNHDIPWDQFQGGISEDTVSALDQKLKGLTLDQLQAMDDLEDQNWRKLVDEGIARLKTKCTDDGISSGLAKVSQALQEYEKAGYLTEDGLRTMSRNALEVEISDKVKKLTTDSPDGDNSYIYEVARERLLKRRAEVQDELFDEATQRADALGITKTDTLSELTAQENALKKVKAELSSPNTDDALIIKLEQQKKELEADVNRLEKDNARNEQASKDAVTDKNRLESEKQIDERNRDAKEREAKRRLEEGLAAE